MTQQIAINVYTLANATAEVLPKRGVNFNGLQATAGEACIGVADHLIEVGTNGRVVTGITGIWETGAAVDAATENRLMVDADGRVIPFVAGGAVVGRLMRAQTAAAAGEFVEVFIVNQGEA